jgi:hypothetical protein
MLGKLPACRLDGFDLPAIADQRGTSLDLSLSVGGISEIERSFAQVPAGHVFGESLVVCRTRGVPRQARRFLHFSLLLRMATHNSQAGVAL